MKTYTIDAKTPKGQAGQMRRALLQLAKFYGQHPEIEVSEVRRDWPEPIQGASTYSIGWEAGPYEWAQIGGSGGNIFREEFEGMLEYKTNERYPPTFKFADHVYFEHYYSFDFIFYPNN